MDAVTAKKFIQLTVFSITLVLLSGFIPVAGIILLFLSVVPQLILLRKRQYFYSVFSWLSVFVILGLVKGWGFTGNYIFLFCLYAIWFNFLIKKVQKPYIPLINAAAAWCILLFVWAGLNYVFFKVNLLEELVKLVRVSGAISIGKYYDLGLPYSQIAVMDSAVNNIIEFFTRSAIGWMIITGITGSWSVYYTLSRYTETPRPPAIKEFRFPESYIWFLILAVILYMAGGRLQENNMLILMAWNMGVVLLGGYFLCGFGLMISIMTRWNFPMFMKFIMIFSLFIFLRGIYFFMIIGIVDVWVNFRKRMNLGT